VNGARYMARAKSRRVAETEKGWPCRVTIQARPRALEKGRWRVGDRSNVRMAPIGAVYTNIRKRDSFSRGRRTMWALGIWFTGALLVNYNLRIINSKIRLFEAALDRPEFNVSQKLGFYRELKKLERDRYIAVITEGLD
jgi:hypothetical protein